MLGNSWGNLFALQKRRVQKSQDAWNCSNHLGPGVKLVPTLFLGEPAIRRDEKSGCCIVVLFAKLTNSVMDLPLDIHWELIHLCHVSDVHVGCLLFAPKGILSDARG